MAELNVVVLAAGEGTRMRSQLPKLLHHVAGLPIISHVVRAAASAGAKSIGVVTGPSHQSIRDAVTAFAPTVQFFEQVERRGTAHAAQMAKPVWADADGYVAIVYGDHPLLRANNFLAVSDRLDAGMDIAILGFEPLDPTGYGRLITDGETLLAIREHKDANAEELGIGLCNACVLMFKAKVFRELIGQVAANNAQGEYYLTDLVELANKAGHRVGYAVADEADVMGVNTRRQLAEAEALFQARLRAEAMDIGVTLVDPGSVFFSYDTKLAQDVLIEPNVVIAPGVEIGSGAVIHAFSHLEGATIGEGASVGPFARLRPGAILAEDVKVGNFVEVKQSRIGAGAKLSHLSYVGDAEVGANANLGAGTITCNYDGINKHQTIIGADAFIGSNSSLVAPVTVGERAYVASGSVVTEDVPVDGVAFGRARQVNKDGHAKTIRDRALKIKGAKAPKE